MRDWVGGQTTLKETEDMSVGSRCKGKIGVGWRTTLTTTNKVKETSPMFIGSLYNGSQVTVTQLLCFRYHTTIYPRCRTRQNVGGLSIKFLFNTKCTFPRAVLRIGQFRYLTDNCRKPIKIISAFMPFINGYKNIDILYCIGYLTTKRR
jgi:hypothetical protein